MANLTLVLVLATSLLSAACATRGMPIMTDPQDVFDYAKRGNWRVRAFSGGNMLEGRIGLVGTGRVRIGSGELFIADLDSLQRSVEIDKGGKVPGAFLGAVVGAGLGLLARAFCEYGGGECTWVDTVKIVTPTVATFAIFGTLIGAAIDPPNREWRMEWIRP